MSLVESLLGAIVRLDGDSLVLHVGEKPYVVTFSSAMNAFRGPLAWGQVELSTRVLTVEAVNSMLDQLLTAEQRQTLEEIGAVDRELPASGDLPAFTVIAARGGDDIWLEVRPIRAKAAEPDADSEPEPELEPRTPAAQPAAVALQPVAVDEAAVATSSSPGLPAQPASAAPDESPAEAPAFEIVPEVEQEQPDEAEVMQLLASAGLLERTTRHAAAASNVEGDSTMAPASSSATVEWVPSDELAQEEEGDQAVEIAPVAAAEPSYSAGASNPAPVVETPPPQRMETPRSEPLAPPPASAAVPPASVTAPPPAAAETSPAAPETPAFAPAAAELPPELPGPSAPQPAAPRAVFEPPAPAPAPEPARPAAVVLPLSRPQREPAIAAVPVAPVSAPDLERLLRIAAARGASGLYLVAQSHPVVRVDGEMQQLDSEESLTPADVEAFMLALAPEPSREAVRTGATSEWFRDVPDLGRIRCLSFRDHRGPGVILRMLPARAISVEQLGLSKEIQALCGQAEGLVLVAGPRASGTSTLIAAFVDLVNRRRSDHVITIERQISFVHESRRSFVSQREVRGDADELALAVRTALREDPDVLVVEELRTADMIATAIEAAESGRLVFAGLRAPASIPALERLVEQFQPERRPHILTSLATSLRGVVGQVLLRKRGGGRIAARELLLNTPAAAALIAEGKLFQLSAALESGRKLGCVALNDALSSLIRDGVVDAGEAWRKAHDRDGLLTALKREGIDTSFVERLA